MSKSDKIMFGIALFGIALSLFAISVDRFRVIGTDFFPWANGLLAVTSLIVSFIFLILGLAIICKNVFGKSDVLEDIEEQIENIEERIENIEKPIKKTQRLWQIVRLCFVLVIALGINLYIIPDLKTHTNELPTTTEDNETYKNIQSYFDLNQEDLSSGNFNAILWKIIYFGSGKDKICFEKTNFTDNEIFSASYNNGEFVNISKKKCFDIPKHQGKITFNLRYTFNVNITNEPLSSRETVDKSNCVPETIDIARGTCITKETMEHPRTEVLYPNGEVYLEANRSHKILKFIFIFLSSGALIWALSRTFVFIREGF